MGWIEGSQVKWLVVVTAVVAAGACSGGADDASNDVSDGSSPSPGPSGPVIEGSIIGDTFHPGYTVELADDWSTLDGAFMVKEDAGTALGMSVWDVKTVPGHPCRWRGTERDVGWTVDELVQALVSQRLRNPTEPVPITLAGYEGAFLELSVPSGAIVTADSEFRSCDQNDNGHRDFVSWWGTDRGERYQQAAGQVDRVWVLDVDGQTLLVDATYTPDTSAADRAELEQVVGSLRFLDEEA